METEIEAKWLNINHEDFRKQLKELNAELKQPERLMKRRILDFSDRRLNEVGGWVRVRHEGDKVTLSYKQLNDRTVHGTKEVTVIVDDFENTCSFLESIGLVSISYQETRRESWKLGNVEVELDTWPWIPSFVELEAPSEKELKDAAEKLGLQYEKALHGSVETAYQAVYDVSDEDIDGWKEIVFSDVPRWLASKAK